MEIKYIIEKNFTNKNQEEILTKAWILKIKFLEVFNFSHIKKNTKVMPAALYYTEKQDWKIFWSININTRTLGTGLLSLCCLVPSSTLFCMYISITMSNQLASSCSCGVIYCNNSAQTLRHVSRGLNALKLTQLRTREVRRGRGAGGGRVSRQSPLVYFLYNILITHPSFMKIGDIS